MRQKGREKAQESRLICMRYVVCACAGKLLRRRPQFRLYTGAHTQIPGIYVCVCVFVWCAGYVRVCNGFLV